MPTSSVRYLTMLNRIRTDFPRVSVADGAPCVFAASNGSLCLHLAIPASPSQFVGTEEVPALTKVLNCALFEKRGMAIEWGKIWRCPKMGIPHYFSIYLSILDWDFP